ncbi:sigma-54-dependent Fis family transcriptional regulator [Pseudonocardia asaccharolytica]|uniref:Fis family transcriptional regulator n=1 Tax=Pseudonocardia asaccharolytica DSM 44247 = NBRC 16224 TaxID=1123024 RepID=A0A511D7D5_9PSEU|nr:helix-turn-helix domain-containing protein [Pseudonocardia asaccharolytica]GEL20333.1 Fis family transcriptional regulator [Pseudonocardia asaccharolytica DSM 44247 = NBRC 16224]
MGDVANQRFLLAVARADFLESGDLELCGVPDHVAASWRRSSSQGVQPHEVAPTYYTELDLGSRLVRCAQSVIERLAEQIADIPISVALTDERARILSRRDSNSWIGRMLDRVYFAQGFDYAEDEVGTNGVGTVLEFGESVHIVGAEHFADPLQTFACAGAPVHDPFTGRIVGVLDISCLSDHSTPMMHSLVRSAVRQIENNLLLDRNQTQQALFDAYSRVDARSRQAVLAVGQRVVMANSPLQALLDPGDQEALQDHVRFVMLRRATVDDRLDLPSGTRVRLRGSTVRVGTEVAGMVGVVSALQEVDSSTGPAIQGGWEPLRAPGAAQTSVGKSHSPAWRAAAATVEAAVHAAHPVLVLGEPGSGRFTLLAELHRLVHDTGRAVALEAAEVEAAPAEATARLLEATPEPTLHVLRDVDRLSPSALDTLADALDRGHDRPRTLAATASEAVVQQATHQRMLAVFSASATVPSLRHRGADLPALVTSLLADLAPHRDVRLSHQALRLLGSYHWPGNIRQLEQALSAALARRPVGAIEAHDLPAFCQSAPRGSLRPVDEIERDAIVTALREADGNRMAAAATLGIARSTLYRKIRQYGITV